MRIPLGLHLGERFTLGETLDVAKMADDRGLDSLWVAEGRLTRDAISPMTLIANNTNRIRIGSGVVNNRSRNAALMAVTFQTLDEIAPGRIMLGIGSWWEPLASMLGLPLKKRLKVMREYVTVLKAFFRNEVVDYDGEFVKIRGARFDRMYSENKPVPVPVYIGAVGMRMLEIAGEISDGVYMDFLLPPEYLQKALPAINRGIQKRTEKNADFDITQIVSCSVDDDDPRSAINHCKAFLTQYLMQQPHIAEHCGVEPALVERIKEIAGWPAKNQDIKKAMQLVPDELVSRVSACGTTSQAIESLEAYRDAGVRVPVISAVGKKMETIESLTKALS